jgi:hypothetical protein
MSFIHFGPAVHLLAAIGLAYASEDCAPLARKGPEEYVKYLALPRTSTETRCVVYVRPPSAGAPALRQSSGNNGPVSGLLCSHLARFRRFIEEVPGH